MAGIISMVGIISVAVQPHLISDFIACAKLRKVLPSPPENEATECTQDNANQTLRGRKITIRVSLG